MKKLFALLAIIGMLSLGATSVVYAQNENDSTAVEEAATDSTAVEAAEETEDSVEEGTELADGEEGIHQQIKQKFIEGGAGFMGIVLLALILGLALSIERIIYLNLASTNTKKLLVNIENALDEGGVESAKEVCRSTKGPVASIFYQGLDRSSEGVEMVEKSVVAYGSVQMGLLEKGLSWIALFIALACILAAITLGSLLILLCCSSYLFRCLVQLHG